MVKKEAILHHSTIYLKLLAYCENKVPNNFKKTHSKFEKCIIKEKGWKDSIPGAM